MNSQKNANPAVERGVGIKRLLFSFLIKNWYKIAFLGILMYIFFQKDLSFTINFKSPFNTQEEVPKESPVQSSTAEEGYLSAVANDQDKMPHIPAPQEQKMGYGSIQRSKELPNAFDLLTQISSDAQLAYLERFVNVAVNEQKKYGIPASIILSNALLHSVAGTHSLVRTGENHFALPCTERTIGKYQMSGDQCFAKYDNAWSSFRAHSRYVSARLSISNEVGYEEWAKALEQFGFGTEQNLAQKLIQIIESYQLHELD